MRPLQQQARWPTVEQLESMGLVRCSVSGCTVFLDPFNVRSDRCSDHRRRPRERQLAEMRFAAIPDRPRRKMAA